MKLKLFSIFILLITFSLNSCGLVWTRINPETITNAEIISTVIKNTEDGSQYLVNLKSNSFTTPEPFEITNNFIGLGRLDRTSVLSQLQDIEKRNKCITVDVHGYRVPSITYRGIGELKEVECQITN